MIRLLSLLPFLCGAVPVAAATVDLILDTDMASDCDDAGALAVIHALADKGEVNLLAVVTNRKDPADASASAVDAINTWYGRGDTPIGTDKDGAKTPPQWNKPGPFCAALRAGFPNDSLPDSGMPDAVPLLRKTLASRPDKSVVYCSIGALSNLEDLIRSTPDENSPLNGSELVKAKVRQTVIMGGGFPRTARPETNIKLDPAAAVTITNEWPAPILWQGFEVGAAMNNGKELQETPEENPVRRAYELRPFHEHNSLESGKPNHDLATVLLAVRGPQEGFWKVTTGGHAVFDSDGNCQWSQQGRKNQSYVSITGHPDKLEKILGELLAAPPVTATTTK